MELTDPINKLRDRTQKRLISAYDYFEDSKFAWRFIERYVQAGEKFGNTNLTTGTSTTEIELVEKSYDYIKNELTVATFQQFIAIFEYWFFDLLRLWLTAYPRNLASRQIGFRDVLDAADKEAVTFLVVEKELLEVAYKKPADWFAYLSERTRIGCPSSYEIECFSEAKAARDAMVHNQGIAGKIYVQKSGVQARFKEGDFIDITEPYHREVWTLLLKILADISDAVAEKAV